MLLLSAMVQAMSSVVVVDRGIDLVVLQVMVAFGDMVA